MNSKLKGENIDYLFKAILKLETIEECYSFFEDLCTVPELKALSQRLHVAKMLSEHRVSHRLARNDVAIWECEGHGEEPRPNRNTPRRASSRRCIGIIQF